MALDIDFRVLDVIPVPEPPILKGSPASAQFVKNRNAVEHAVQYPEAAAAIIDRHYIDDYFDSVDTIEEAVVLAKQVRYVHEQAGFQIRNWVSNSPAVLSALGEDTSSGPVVSHQDKESPGERVLGVFWDLDLDVFAFSVTQRAEVKEYLYEGKRIVLSCVMGLFDPLGLLSPFTIHGKVIIQHIWRNGCEWDQVIDEQSWCVWKQWTKLLPEVEALRIPRCYLGDAVSSSVESLELHVFTDTSEHAYGCVAYLRSVINGTVRCSLIMSRAKVAPLKRQSIPRLELMAAVLGARMSQTIIETHSLRIGRTVLWTDSRTILSWLQSDQHRFKQFVAFRAGEILELTRMRDWRWVRTKQNIADVLTKWGRGPPLQNDSEWIYGPSVLYQSSDQWPSSEPIEETVEETRRVMLFHAVVEAETVSSWTKLVHVTATVLRFISNCQRKRAGLPIVTCQSTNRQRLLIKAEYLTDKKPLQQEELQKAEIILWRQAQYESFPDEMNTLTKNLESSPGQRLEKIEKTSSLYKRSPVLDEEGVLRVRGRLEKNEELPFNKRYPIILSGKHEITKKLILHFHNKFGHANRETVFNELRQKFWIPKARAAIRHVTKEYSRANVAYQNKSFRTTPPASVFATMMKTMQGINIKCAGKVTSAVTAWHFNPPSTPHMGGVWERMVRSVKEALRAYEDGRKLTDEILSTSLAEAEDMINTRPLTYVPQEAADEEAAYVEER
ncbi:uncharacterized protein LOC135711744 [Ochlerotatus camptorhynchus]|uniref:uncharacterized protein LOC135711744 n=1 Tax=Ochlerotatus camptorhynchus TaxID=644619 RepID=UPI0031CDE264